MDSSTWLIIKTLLYSDIFDFPLTKDELWFYLITSQKVSKKEFEAINKAEIYKPNTKTAVEPDEIRVALEIVPRSVLSSMIAVVSQSPYGTY